MKHFIAHEARRDQKSADAEENVLKVSRQAARLFSLGCDCFNNLVLARTKLKENRKLITLDTIHLRVPVEHNSTPARRLSLCPIWIFYFSFSFNRIFYERL